MGGYRIPFNKPYLAGNEYRYIAEALAHGHAAGDGMFTAKCHAFLEKRLGVGRAFLTTSCTHALEMCALLLNLKPGDEVIVPSFTFVSTANAFALHGARPVFVDVRPDTLNLDETRVEARITPRTRAIVVMHYGGVACEMDALGEIAGRRNLVLIEDNAHGFLGRYRGGMLGTLGALATLSFHETKNVISGEGGALLISDPGFIERAEIIRDKGTNRKRFFRGEVDKYTWVDLGSSYLPTDIVAAYLYAQLETVDEIQSMRRRIWENYLEGLREWASERGVTLPGVPGHCEQPYHMFYLLLPTSAKRDALISHLRSKGILSVFHYQPLHLSVMGKRFGAGENDCPVSEDVSARLVRLPFYNSLGQEEQADVVAGVRGCPGI